ncbi:MAG: DUF6314 family protein [Rhizobiaceae bacterium]
MVADLNDYFHNFFAGLSGEWQLNRQISNGTRFEGSALFSRKSEFSHCLEEKGQLFLQQYNTMNAMRQWQWIWSKEGHLDVKYPVERGGDSYHHVELVLSDTSAGLSLEGEAIHYCGNDIYAGSYRLAQDRLKISHEISGPNKNLIVDSRYTR